MTDFTLLYILLCICIIYPPNEFISSGITIPDLFSSVLGSESQELISYHIKRSSLTLLVYSLIPLGYLVGLFVFGYQDEVSSVINSEWSMWHLFFTTAFVLPLFALYQIKNWSRDNWKSHPISLNIAKFCNRNSEWSTVAADINAEYRRLDKFCVETSPLSKIIATENWILKVTPLNLFIAHQCDANLVVKESNTHNISLNNLGEVEFLQIEVKSNRSNVGSFTLRIRALDFQNLQDQVARAITILPHIKFHKTVIDRFIDAFKDATKDNPIYVTNQELEPCMACMQNSSNVKLQKICSDIEGSEENCKTCYCRPMWCIDCLARWFASKQDEVPQETWLSSKCTCPMCRATFCILDVCPVQND